MNLDFHGFYLTFKGGGYTLTIRILRQPQSRGGSCVFADGFPAIQPGTARLPRRFTPRNDKSEAITILTAAGTDWKCAAGSGMPLPYSGAHHLMTAGTERQCLPEIPTLLRSSE